MRGVFIVLVAVAAIVADTVLVQTFGVDTQMAGNVEAGLIGVLAGIAWFG